MQKFSRCRDPFSCLVLVLLASLALAACAGGGGPQTQPETTQTSPEEERVLDVRQVDSGSLGQGNPEPRAVVAGSPESLAAATGLQGLQGVEDTTADEGTAYVAVFWGEQNTGGYEIEVEGARLEGGTVEVSVALQSPPEGAIVSQALTYPYAVAEIPDLDPADREFVLADQDGNELGWPVELAEN